MRRAAKLCPSGFRLGSGMTGFYNPIFKKRNNKLSEAPGVNGYLRCFSVSVLALAHMFRPFSSSVLNFVYFIIPDSTTVIRSCVAC